METTTTIERHPDWYYDVPDMTLLILGTYPPHSRKRNFQFYYPNKINRFWKAMAALADTELQYFGDDIHSVQERQKLMSQLKIGVQNLAYEIRHKGTSSADQDIEILRYQKNLKDILFTYPQLKSILLTGFTGQTSTFHGFVRYLNENKILHTAPAKPQAGTAFQVNCAGRTLHCWIGNSTSTAARKINLETVLTQFRQAWKDSHR